jgi:retron-type reverse transcriptase
MAKSPAEELYAVGAVGEDALFADLFSAASLHERFSEDFSRSSGKGTDRLNGFQFAARAAAECTVASAKCNAGTYRFAPYLENLKPKGRSKLPRLIAIPTVRDRIVLSQLNKFLAAICPDCVPRNIASAYVRQVFEDLKTKRTASTWICSTDIKTFYDSIQQDRLVNVLGREIANPAALRLVKRALQTPTVPRNTKRVRHDEFRPERGVPQGLAISNILAAIYMKEVDDAMKSLGVAYYRYVDDVLMYGRKEEVEKALRSFRARLRRRGLALHPESSGKTILQPVTRTFGYLGYTFTWPHVSVREATVERFLQSIAAKFSDYVHNKSRRLDRFDYLTEARLREIFLSELNERITGAISEKKRYGWIAYFNQITDLSLLHRLDRAIARMFERLPDFGRKPPVGLRILSRAYFEMKFNPTGGYVRDYDKIVTRAEKLKFLEERGRIGPKEALTDAQIEDRYAKYMHHVLATMHADESLLYG